MEVLLYLELFHIKILSILPSTLSKITSVQLRNSDKYQMFQLLL
jgi:hypothetical protein